MLLVCEWHFDAIHAMPFPSFADPWLLYDVMNEEQDRTEQIDRFFNPMFNFASSGISASHISQ